mmetsp:Transcript_21609/g.60058  ORF Transcript_21609/g.60058 Transcript_21609/m.60058 type:complete len:351 (-) Transcript_21609:795-1847(-)
MYSCLGMRLRAASSSSSGRLVAPTSSTRRSAELGSQPSIWTSISVFSRREDSCSPSDLRALSRESISSMKMTEGCRAVATAKRVRTIFSPWPIHLLVSEEAEMLKKVAWMLLAMALPIRVLPVPGGPKSSSPFGGALAPLKMWGFIMGQTTISCTNCLACSWPAMSSHCTSPPECMTSLHTSSTSMGSSLEMASGSSPSGPASSCSERAESPPASSSPKPPGLGPAPEEPPPAPPPPPFEASMPFRTNGGTYPPLAPPLRPPRDSPRRGAGWGLFPREPRLCPFLRRSATRTSLAEENIWMEGPSSPWPASLPGPSAWGSSLGREGSRSSAPRAQRSPAALAAPFGGGVG